MDPIHQPQFSSKLVSFGSFRCPPTYPAFEDTGPIRRGHIIVFPRTSVRITHAGRDPIIADPNVVMFYNDGQVYRRAKISERGDLCEWFAFAPTVITDALRDYEPATADEPDRPFRLTHGPSNPQSYMAQRLVVEHVTQCVRPDTLQIEEVLLHVFVSVIHNAYAARGHRLQTATATRAATRRTHTDLVHAVQELLAAGFREALSLAQIAVSVHSSPYRLCRIFRQQTGVTIHYYLDQLRLRTALERIPNCDGDLTALALDLGYSSHSHFTYAFRRTFGLPPSHLVQAPPGQHLCELGKNLIV